MSIEFYRRYLSSPPEQVSQSEYKHAPSIVPAVWECWENWRQNTETISKSISSRLTTASWLSFIALTFMESWLTYGIGQVASISLSDKARSGFDSTERTRTWRSQLFESLWMDGWNQASRRSTRLSRPQTMSSPGMNSTYTDPVQ